jgi:peptide deformylase
VIRAAEVDLVWQDRSGAEHSATMRGLVAICAQHEFDHLDGITFVDRLSPLKKRIALRDYTRAHRETIDDKQFRAQTKVRRPPQTVSNP